MNIEDNIAMAKRSVVDTIWKQANLEGIGITFPDTYAVYEATTQPQQTYCSLLAQLAVYIVA